MPVANDTAAPGGGRGGKKPPKTPILTLPPTQSPTAVVRPGNTSTSAAASAGKGAGKAGALGASAGMSGSAATSSSSSASSDYTKAQRARDLSARDRLVDDARQLDGQIAALRHTLGSDGTFKKALKGRLANIRLVLGQQQDDLDKAEAARTASLDQDARNNEAAAGDSTSRNDTNRARERMSALTEAMAQGSGESDALKSQLMSLRAGESNQAEIDRSFQDTARSINGSRVDLALDTHNARVNMVTEANADKEQLWTTFFNQTSETQTQLGNALGQQAEYFGLAQESARNAGGPGASTTTSSSSSSSTSKGSKKGGKSKGRPLGSGQFSQDRDPQASFGRTAFGSGTAEPTGSLSGRDDLDEVRYAEEDLSGARLPGKGKLRGFVGSSSSSTKGGGRGTKKYGKGLKGQRALAEDQSDAAFMAAANAQGRTWKNPGIGDDLANWQPPTFDTPARATSVLQSARTIQPTKGPEGATLRKW